MAERVLILGGGSGGTILANSLDPRRFEVTLLSASMEHLFQPGLLYVAFKGSRARLVRDERRLVRRHVRLVHDRVAAVDLAQRKVTTVGGSRLFGQDAKSDYDTLVIATGMTTDPGSIPGLAEVTARVGDYHSTIAQAQKLFASIQRFEKGTIALGQSTPICKCPPSPVEGILLLDEHLRRRGIRAKAHLVFFTPYPRAYPAEPMNEIVAPILQERGIEVRTFFDVERVDPASGTIYSIEGEEIACDLPILIPPFVGADIDYRPTEVLDESRFVRTDRESLQVLGVEQAYAIGDATNLPTSKAGVGAHLEAKLVASALEGHPRPFNGRTNCPMDVAGGRGTFVVGSYDAPVRKSPPTRLKHLMKVGFAYLYWMSLTGALDPVFDVYFRLTEPRAPATQAAA
jgi:sulfide:quinone oxidoreductase